MHIMRHLRVIMINRVIAINLKTLPQFHGIWHTLQLFDASIIKSPCYINMTLSWRSLFIRGEVKNRAKKEKLSHSCAGGKLPIIRDKIINAMKENIVLVDWWHAIKAFVCKKIAFSKRFLWSTFLCVAVERPEKLT